MLDRLLELSRACQHLGNCNRFRYRLGEIHEIRAEAIIIHIRSCGNKPNIFIHLYTVVLLLVLRKPCGMSGASACPATNWFVH